MGPEKVVDVTHRTWYLLASAARGPHRLSVRYDWFRARDEDRYSVVEPNDERCGAWTVACSFEFDRRTSVLLELLSVDSTRPGRALVSLPERARVALVQVGVRGRL